MLKMLKDAWEKFQVMWYTQSGVRYFLLAIAVILGTLVVLSLGPLLAKP